MQAVTSYFWDVGQHDYRVRVAGAQSSALYKWKKRADEAMDTAVSLHESCLDRANQAARAAEASDGQLAKEHIALMAAAEEALEQAAASALYARVVPLVMEDAFDAHDGCVRSGRYLAHRCREVLRNSPRPAGVPVFLDAPHAITRVTLPEFKAVQDNIPATLDASVEENTFCSQRVTIVTGETGCGKSTQAPRIIFNATNGAMTAVTQPLRVPAIAVATRVAEENGEKQGIREAFATGRDTRWNSNLPVVFFLTEGSFVAMAASDPLLSGWKTVMFV